MRLRATSPPPLPLEFVSEKRSFKVAFQQQLWQYFECLGGAYVLIICASQQMSHLCRCPGHRLGVATPCRPHGETSGSWLSMTPAMSLGRYESPAVCVDQILFTVYADKKGPRPLFCLKSFKGGHFGRVMNTAL